MNAMNAEIRITRGRPADDEVAALVAVVLALAERRAGEAVSAGRRPARPEPGPHWTSKVPYRPPGAWTSVQIARPMPG